MAFNLTNRPVLGPVEPVQVVDLIGGQHRHLPLCSRSGGETRRMLFARRGEPGRDGEVLQSPRSWAEAELLFARSPRAGPTSQTCAAECFRSRAEVLFARLHSCRFRSRGFCCWRFWSTLRDAPAVLLPVVGIAGAPLARTVAATLAVFRIGGDLLSVVFGAALPLASHSATDRLPRLKLRRLEDLLAIAATPFTHTAVVASAGRRHRYRADLETAVECLPRPRQWHPARLHHRGNCGCFKPGLTVEVAFRCGMGAEFLDDRSEVGQRADRGQSRCICWANQAA